MIDPDIALQRAILESLSHTRDVTAYFMKEITSRHQHFPTSRRQTVPISTSGSDFVSRSNVSSRAVNQSSPPSSNIRRVNVLLREGITPVSRTSRPAAATSPPGAVAPTHTERHSPTRSLRISAQTGQAHPYQGLARPRRPRPPNPPLRSDTSAAQGTRDRSGAGRGRGPARRPPRDDPEGLEDRIAADIVVEIPDVREEDVVGCAGAKRLLREAVALPAALPDLFTGIREPWRGVLLFGPPGTGKTLLARAVAAEAKCTFFNTSAATLVSKWHGESERLVHTLFRMARDRAPSVVFFDEIDAIGTARGGPAEHEASRRLKAQLLTEMDGLMASPGRVVVIATTNRPWDLDEALRRRFERRIHVPLPDADARRELIRRCLGAGSVMGPGELTQEFLDECVAATEGYSCADIRTVCRDAALEPMRRLLDEAGPEALAARRAAGDLDARHCAVTREDVRCALRRTRPSVAGQDVQRHHQWMEEFGAG